MSVIYVVIVGLSWKYLKWLAQETVQLQVSHYSQLSDHTVRLQFCWLISAKYSSLCTNHIWGNCNDCDYLCNFSFFRTHSLLIGIWTAIIFSIAQSIFCLFFILFFLIAWDLNFLFTFNEIYFFFYTEYRFNFCIGQVWKLSRWRIRICCALPFSNKVS